MSKYWLIAILVLSAILRIWQIDRVPPSPSLDEVSLGYNAYSLLTSGRDEYGQSWPLLLRAYDDWRPALYVYLVVPWVKLLGLTVTAVRLPSVILSLLTVFLTYLLVKELWRHQKAFSFVIWHLSFGIAEVAALLLAISPWHIYLSRLGHEVNLGLFADVAAAFFFLLALQKKNQLLLAISAIFWAMALYSYQSQKVIVPGMVLGLGIIFRKQLWQIPRAVMIAATVGFFLTIPLIKSSFTPEALIRFRATSAFTLDNPLFRESQEAFTRAKLQGDLTGQVVSHRAVSAAKIFWINYITHFDPRWLFAGTARENHKVPYLGLMYWWELPLVLVGLLALFSLPNKLAKRFILLWLLVSPVPAAISTQAPHAMRVFSALPYVQILSGLGFITLLKSWPGRRWILISLAGALGVASTAFLGWQYFWTFPQNQSDSFQYALSQSILYVRKHGDLYDKIVFSNESNLAQSYMFYLFYSRYSPQKYLKEGGTVSGGFAQPHAFDKLEFRPLNWPIDSKQKNVLLLGNPSDFPAGVAAREKFFYLNGTLGVVAVEP